MKQIPLGFEESPISPGDDYIPSCLGRPSLDSEKCSTCGWFINCLAEEGVSEESKKKRDKGEAKKEEETL